MMFRILAGVFAVFGIGWGFGLFLPTDAAKAVGMVAAALLALIVSTVPIGPVA
jgi:hypothetical protein